MAILKTNQWFHKFSRFVQKRFLKMYLRTVVNQTARISQTCTLKNTKIIGMMGSVPGTSDHIYNLRKDIVCIYMATIDAFQPHQLLERVLQINQGILYANNRKYKLDNNVYIVGFGKAVIGMIRAAEDIIGKQLIKGIVSVPIGTQEALIRSSREGMLPLPNSRIRVYEGANHDVADGSSHNTAMKILRLAKSLTKEHLLLVFVSSGGSALLPAPVPPITLEEKNKMSNLLASKGASMMEINMVQKHMSLLKGGGLVHYAYPAEVISVVLANVIGKPMELIAGGPTFPKYSTAHASLTVLKKYNVENAIPQSILQHLKLEARKMEAIRRWNEEVSEAHSAEPGHGHLERFSNVNNILVGTSSLALEAAKQAAESRGFFTYTLSEELSGEARTAGACLAGIAHYICEIFDMKSSKRRYNTDITMIEFELIQKYKITKNDYRNINDIVTKAFNAQKGICILTGGETSVLVKGKGIGGKNQELALSWSIELERILKDEELKKNFQIYLLSANTNGTDGITEMAGAISYLYQMPLAFEMGLDPREYLDNNDSYTFYSKFKNGMDLINIGMTGTSVMDTQILLIKPTYFQNFTK